MPTTLIVATVVIILLLVTIRLVSRPTGRDRCYTRQRSVLSDRPVAAMESLEPRMLMSAVSGFNSANVSIPDNGDWIYSTIQIDGAPEGAEVIDVDVSYRIRHPYSGDLEIDLDVQGSSATYRLRDNEGAGTDDPAGMVNGIDAFDGLSPNRTWYLYARDTEALDSGYIDQWSVTVHYTLAGDTIKPVVGSFSVGSNQIAIGGAVQASYRVSDSGGSNLNRLELWRADDDGGRPRDSSWTQVAERSLGGAESTSGTLTDTPSRAGTYWYGVHAVDNAGNLAFEPNSPGPLRVEIMANETERGEILSVSAPSFTGGQTTIVTVHVRNLGAADDMIIEAYSLPDGWDVGRARVNPYLESGETYSALFAVTPPASGGSGTIEWRMYDDDLGIHPIGSDLLDTWRQSVSASAEPADLVARSFNSDEPLEWGQAFFVDGAVRNEGPIAAAPSVASFYVSPDRDITTDDIFLGSRSIGRLASGQTVDFDNHLLTLPASPPSGFDATDYVYIGMLADGAAAIAESDETNNDRYDSVRVKMPPQPVVDLVSRRVNADERLAWGGTFRVDGQIENDGTITSPSSTVSIVISPDRDITMSDYRVGSLNLGPIAAGETARFDDLVVMLPSAPPAGFTSSRMYVGLIADGDGVIAEFDEANNSRRYDAVRVAMPTIDLESRRVNSDERLEWGEDFRVDGSVRNRGTITAPASTVAFYLSTDRSITSTDHFLGSMSLGPIAAGETVRFDDHMLTMPSALPTGFDVESLVYIGMIVDAGNAIDEPNEANNARRYDRVRVRGDVVPARPTRPSTAAGWYSPLERSLPSSGNWLAHGDDYTTDRPRAHVGLDLGATAGDRVYALSAGIVIGMSAGGAGDGNVALFVRHQSTDGDFVAVYGHIRTALRVGDSVSVYNPIGAIGPWVIDGRRVHGDHLHLGIRPGTMVPLGTFAATGEAYGWGAVGERSYLEHGFTNGFVDPLDWLNTVRPL